MTQPERLFSEEQIAARVTELAVEIAAAAVRPDIVAPILVGGFVFAADLLRALAQREIYPGVEMLWLRSYGAKRSVGEISVINGPSETVRGAHVLIADGVLDGGRTVQTASALLMTAGAASVRIAVAIDKRRPDALTRADFAAFCDVRDFIIGYGMDDEGRYRALPYIGRVRTV